MEFEPRRYNRRMPKMPILAVEIPRKCMRCGLKDMKRIMLSCGFCNKTYCMGCHPYHMHKKKIIKWAKVD